MKAQLFR